MKGRVILISGNGLPWNLDRAKSFTRFMTELKVGDSIVSQDGAWKIIFLFINSKVPQYAIYHDGIRVFPVSRKTTPRRNEIMEYLMNQDSKSELYFDHKNMAKIENGCIELMTDIEDALLPIDPPRINSNI